MSLDPLWLQSHHLLRVIERLLPALHVGVCRTPVREEDGAVGVERDGLGVEIDRLGEEAALQCRVPLRLVPLRLVHIRHWAVERQKTREYKSATEFHLLFIQKFEFR